MENLNTMLPMPKTINFRGNLRLLDRPMVMGILNLTPDSFSDGGRYQSVEQAVKRVGEMLEAGADLIDIGGASSRPGAAILSAEDEWGRISKALNEIVRLFPEAILSIDTYQAEVARRALDGGVHAVNDISAGKLDSGMIPLLQDHPDVPFFLMHLRGNPQTMQTLTAYDDVVAEVYAELLQRVMECRAAGIRDIVVDPGFGFSKTLEQNYTLLRNLEQFTALGLPLLVGISRKSMVYKPVGGSPEDVSDLTAALHFQALDDGAKFLRVHDVKETVRLVRLHCFWKNGTV